jgi:cell cycle checkpoint protein
MDAMNLLSVQQTSALDSFDEFLQQSGSGLASLRLTSSSCSNVRGSDLGGYEKSIILLEDLPNLYGQEAELQFRTLMRRHLQRSYAPTVLVFSDVSEGRHRPEDLERLIDPDDLYSNECTTIMQIHSVTKSKMKKILSAVTTQERCSLTSSFLEEIHLQSNGDMRQALMTLQLHATGSLELLDDNNYKNEFHTTRQNDRDTKLSTFHALGKLLYSKRKMGDDGRDCLAFDPEEILERSDLGVEGSLRFLEYHSGDFFTDIGELSNAYDYFSDAAELLGQSTSSHQDDSSTISPFACASSIAGRAVANTNFHPAPNRFRQFSKPKVFDVLRKGRQNQFLMDQLSRRLSTDLLSTSSTLGHLGTFVTDALPFLRLIVPYEIDPFVDHLYSVAGDDFRGRRKIVPQTEEAGLKEQEEILGMDDIAEYDSEDYGDGAKVSSKRKEEP